VLPSAAQPALARPPPNLPIVRRAAFGDLPSPCVEESEPSVWVPTPKGAGSQLNFTEIPLALLVGDKPWCYDRCRVPSRPLSELRSRCQPGRWNPRSLSVETKARNSKQHTGSGTRRSNVLGSLGSWGEDELQERG